MTRILKGLKIAFVIALMFGFVFGVVYLISKEESEAPKYTIRTEHDLYKTDSFTIDSNQCINFNAIEFKLLNGNRTRNVQICGGRYIIEEKWKR